MGGSRSIVARAGVLLWICLAGGCGTKFKLPTESPEGIVPQAGSYGLLYRWEGFEGALDLILTRGAQVFVAEPSGAGDGTMRVRAYFRLKQSATPTGLELPGLTRPSRLAEGPRGEIFVMDLGPPPAVRRYSAAGNFLSAFSDTLWEEADGDSSRPNPRTSRVTNSTVGLPGLAVDEEGNVFVSWIDSTYHFDRDLIDTTVVDTMTTLVVSHGVLKYTTDGIFLEMIAPRGSGEGFVDGPGGLQTGDNGLLLADVNKNWVQLVDSVQPSTPRLRIDGRTLEDDPGLLAPLDVATDDSGSVYVADTGKGRVLKFDADGFFDQRVDLAPGSPADNAVLDPIAITASSSLVYALDRQLGEILIYELRSGLVIDDQGN